MKIHIKNIVKYALTILFCTVISISTSFAQNSGQPLSKSNLKIFVQYKLAKAHLLTDDNIKVEIKDNNIILSGTVPTINDKNQAEFEAQSVDEDYLVINNITVVNASIEDTALESIITEKIQSNLFYTLFDWITVRCDNGIVTLQGWVHLPWLKSQFQTEIEKIPGVAKVDNKIQNTFGPGEIGIRAARLIYNDPMFYGLQYSSNPPIHIIVNNGTVVLEGHVNSEVQSNWAANLISFKTDAFSVENNLQVVK